MYQIVVHYPISEAEEAKLPENVYPSKSIFLGKYVSLKKARHACRAENRKLKSPAYAAVVDLASGCQL